MKKKISGMLILAMILVVMCGYSQNVEKIKQIEAKKEEVENLRVRDLHGLRAVDTYEIEVEKATVSDAALNIEINDCLLLKEE